MSEPVTLPLDGPIERSAEIATQPVQPTANAGWFSDPPSIAPSMFALPGATDPEMRAVLELINRGLAPDADVATRAAARDLWMRFAQSLAMGHAPTTPPAAPGLPEIAPPLPATMSGSPLVSTARALRELPPEQLFDLLLQRLRSALPNGVAVANPKGIQFQLIPVPPLPNSR